MIDILEKFRLIEAKKVLYHGSISDDPRFIIGHTGKNSHTFGSYDSTRYGIFLTDNPKFAAIYGTPRKYVVYPKSTFDFNNSHHISQAEYHFLSVDSDVPDDVYNAARYTKHEWEWFENELGKYFVQWLKDRGFDSATFVEYHDDEDGGSIPSNTFVLLDPHLIRKDSGDQMDIHDKIYEDVAYKNEMVGYHHGQSDMVLRAKIDGKQVGFIDYSVYDGKPYLKMIEVSPEFKRKGIATGMLKHLQSKYPDEEIEWGYMTDDGSKLYSMLKFKKVKNFDPTYYNSLKDELRQIRPTDDEGWKKISQEDYDRIYDLEDEIERIEQTDVFNKPFKKIII